MSDGMLLQIRDDGTAELYDDTYDITIHCTSQEEQDAARVLLRRAGAIPHWVSQDDIPRWIPCSERLPAESGCYLVSANDKEVFNLYYSANYGWHGWWNGRVLAWMPLPEPYVPERRTE